MSEKKLLLNLSLSRIVPAESATPALSPTETFLMSFLFLGKIYQINDKNWVKNASPKPQKKPSEL